MLVGKEESRFIDAGLLNCGKDSVARSVETRNGAAFAGILADVEARKIVRRKVDTVRSPTEFFTLFDFCVGSGKQFHDGQRIPSCGPKSSNNRI